MFLMVVFLSEYTWTFPAPPIPALDPFSLIPCRWRLRTATFFWVLFKFSHYFFFLERLFMIFRNVPELEFQKCQISGSRILLFGSWASQQGLIMLINDDPDSSICINETPPWLFGLVFIVDIVIATSISVMFSRRLLALHVQTTSIQMTPIPSNSTTAGATSADTDSSTTVKLARKSTILSIVALITSEMTLICFAVTKIPQIWLPLDAAINSWCVMLIFHEHT